jgi:cohesin domain-containing protein
MKKLIILIVSILLYSCSNSSDPEPKPTILLSPASSNISLGAQTELNIVIQDNQKSIFGISMQIDYNGSMLNFIDSTGFVAGNMFDQGAVSFIQRNGSTIHLSLSQLNGQLSANGSGTVGTLKFQANTAGNSVVSILQDELYFYDSIGDEIAISGLIIESASVMVQ